ncbi:MAG: hydantoinase/oxoprolinase family protein [Acidimicrobiales bacterium]
MSHSGDDVVGIDVGGTFTDVFALDQATGVFRVAKVSSTRGDEARGFIAGVAEAVDGFDGVAALIHGTTVGTNALIERAGAQTGLITTAGFRDVLEMRRRDRPNTWGLWGDFEPVVARDLRLEVAERIGADGTVVIAVDPAEVKSRAVELLEAGAEAICVAFINAYANDHNEQAAVAAVREVWPNDHVTASAELLPEVREFERTSTAVLNAYLQPVVGDYLGDLEVALHGGGFAGQFSIVQSNGGVMTAAAARQLPVRTALSGPAAGVIASAHLAEEAGFKNVITCDMGGTSFDVAVIAEGRTVTSAQASVDFGLVIRTPMIEISTIGAGGGSIAWVDNGRLLRIGPESAGSNPGPACYARGNDRPTVTDAQLVLGRINADAPIGGLDRLDMDLAKAAISTHVAEKLDLGLDAAAEAVLRVATSRMAGAIRLVSIERGHDPGAFVAMPFGGAGALHACGLISEVGLAQALVPRYPGVTSAIGCAIADIRHDVVHSVDVPVADLDGFNLEARLRSAEGDLRTFLERSGLALDDVVVTHELEMAYAGQTHTVSVPLATSAELTTANVQRHFDEAYAKTYGRVLEGIAARVVASRSAIVGFRPKLDSAALAPTTSVAPVASRRKVFFDGSWHDTPVYPRLELPAGWSVVGPAVLEQPDATVVIEPGFGAEVDSLGNLLIGAT